MCSNKIPIKVIDDKDIIISTNDKEQSIKDNTKESQPEIFDFWKLFYGIKD